MKRTKKLLSLLLVLCLVLSLSCTAFAADEAKPYDGKTVILHSNDVHGAINLYAAIAAMKADYEAQGAEVILADAGDYSQGTVYVSVSKGADAVTMMNAAGYDVATIGNHEFDYGYEQLAKNMENAKFQVLCADVLGADDQPIFDANTIIEKDGVKIGFFGLETPEAQTKANPKLIKGLKFLAGQGGSELYQCAQQQVASLKEQGANLIVCLAHLGVDDSSKPYTSYDLYRNVSGIDFIIDGHSHSVMTKGTNGEPIQSTGTAFANIGVITIDNATKKIEGNDLMKVSEYTKRDAAVAAAAKAIIDPIDKAYGEKFAVSKVKLNGTKAPDGNRDSETNLGDLITDAMLWKIRTQAEVSVPAENVVALTNGGGIRATIKAGDVTKKDINTVLPFGNTLAVVYVTGAELLEALEASTYCTPEPIGGFPQVAGLCFTIQTYEKYDANEQTYPASTYYGPASIKRVTITEVNGKAFDPAATYAVVTNNFVAGGGDTYYAFAAAKDQFDTGMPLDEVVMEYVSAELKGVIDKDYATPAGRITVDQGIAPKYDKLREAVLDEQAYVPGTYDAYAAACAKMNAAETEPERVAAYPEVCKATESLRLAGNTFADAESGWYKGAVDYAQAAQVMGGVGDNRFAPNMMATRAMVAQVLYAAEGWPSVADMRCPFTDVPAGAWYADAVTWAYNAGVVGGRTATTFAPDDTITRQEMAVMLCAWLIGDDVYVDDAVIEDVLATFDDGGSVADWARRAVTVCCLGDLMVGVGDDFDPQGGLARAQLAQVMRAALYDVPMRDALNVPAQQLAA